MKILEFNFWRFWFSGLSWLMLMLMVKDYIWGKIDLDSNVKRYIFKEGVISGIGSFICLIFR